MADMVLGITIAAVIGVFFWLVRPDVSPLGPQVAAEAHYNRLTEGFRAGTLSLKRDVPTGLTQLVDPYDPAANAPYRSAEAGLHDVSYYRGRLFLYFGVTPVLVAFWPWLMLTGHYLAHAQATAALCAAGFLAAALLLRSVWRRCFPDVNVTVAAAGIVALGLATSVPLMLQRPDFYEVAVSGGYAMTMLAIAAVWCALCASTPGRRAAWVAVASAACGLAVGSRPSLLFGATILAVPLLDSFFATPQENRRRLPWRLVCAALVPIVAVGIGLALYNYLRFGDPFEFGQNYQLADDRQTLGHHFSVAYLWFNFRLYFLAPLQWLRGYPFVADVPATNLPPGHGPVTEDPLGLIVSVPFVWLALAAPLAWRGRNPPEGRPLRWIAAAAVLLFVTAALVICLFYGAANRYEVEFAPALVLLAGIGLLGLERWAARRSRPQRIGIRTAWIVLLLFSVGLNWLAGADRAAVEAYSIGSIALEKGDPTRAVPKLEAALRIKPSYAEAHNELGLALNQLGRPADALVHFTEAVRLAPKTAAPRLNLALALAAENRSPEAQQQFERVVQLDPGNALAQYDLGLLLANAGQMSDAIEHLSIAVRLQPGEPTMRQALAGAFLSTGRLAEGIVQLRELLRLRPGDTEVKAALTEAEAALRQGG